MATIDATTGSADAELEQLRGDRERFVAFAFCGADILLELDPGQQVTFAGGAIRELTGYGDDELLGRNLLDLVAPDERRLLNEVLRCAADGERLQPKLVRLAGARGPTPPLAMTGYCLPDLGGRYYLAFRMGPPVPPAEPGPRARRDPESGLYDAEAFRGLAGARMRQAGRDDAWRLTFVELGDFARLRERLDAETREEVIRTIGAHLRAQSLFGDSAARIDDARFGVLHGHDVEAGDLEARIDAIARAADPEGDGVVVRTAGIDLDVEGMSDAEAVRALAYTIGKYAADRDQPLSVHSLSEALATMVEETGRQMREIKSKARSGTFDVAFQPIIDLETGAPRHLEALARFGDAGRSPAGIIRFAEDVAVVAEFDLAMCHKLIERLERADAEADRPRIAVNISQRSAADGAFERKLDALLDAHPGIAERLIFEITESAGIADFAGANRFIQGLRARGHEVCLDDFGSCADALHFLQELQVDLVKIDGRHLEEALAANAGTALLRALVGLCAELSVLPIANRVEKREMVPRLRACGIRLVQGYLFGPPSDDPRAEGGDPDAAPDGGTGWATPRVGALAIKSTRRG